LTAKYVLFDKSDDIGVMTFNRPEVMNAHNYEMKREMQTVAEAALADDDIRVLIVTGAGRGFHAGEDVKNVMAGEDMQRIRADRNSVLVGRLGADSWTGQVSPKYFFGYPKPTIAAVNGPAVGAGLSIALGCDVRIASEEARFGFLYPRLGLLGSTRAMTMLVQVVGASRAMEMMLSGELVDAAEADRIGLVSRVVPRERLLEAARETAFKLMKGAPLAQRAIKACIYKSLFDQEEVEQYGYRVEVALSESDDHKEAVAAFAEKRQPMWRRA
jgi:enoyl-CoA hydratase